MNENVVEISGSLYRYGYDSSSKKTRYLGPVGSSGPLSEAEFLKLTASFNLDIPNSEEFEAAKQIIGRLEDAGFDTYIVGGAVRDLVMGIEPHDYDIATSATPEEIKQVFGEDVAPTIGGDVHGTVLIKDPRGKPFEAMEVTTFRKEVYDEKTGGRKPSEVAWTREVEEDLGRRDLTINAMAMKTDGSVLDPFGGIDDIRKRLIRSVGDPDRRFNEDRLRMLRAVRFSSRFQFDIEDETKESIRRNKDSINEVRNGNRVVSWERIRGEYDKGFSKQMFEVAADVGMLDETLPEIADLIGFEQRNPYHYGDVYVHTMDVVGSAVDMGYPDEVKWAALLHDAGKLHTRTEEEVEGHDSIHRFRGHEKASAKVLTRLKFKVDEKEYIKILIANHMLRPFPSPDDKTFGKQVDKWERKMMAKVQKNPDKFKSRIAGDMLLLRKSDGMGHLGADKVMAEVEAIQNYRESRKPVKEIKPVLSGHDLMEMGYDRGPRLGVITKAIKEWQEELGYEPTREMAEDFVQSHYT